MTAISAETALIGATDDERAALAQLAQFLAEQLRTPVRLVGADGTEVPLPDVALRVLRATVHSFVLNQAVAILPTAVGVSTQEAAAFLNVRPDYVRQLLETGELPSYLLDSERRIHAGDLLLYQAQRREREREGLDELTRLSEELGMYDADFPTLVEE